MKIGNRIKWNKATGTIIGIDGDVIYIHLDCNIVKWVKKSELLIE